jgi:hypothetical protein
LRESVLRGVAAIRPLGEDALPVAEAIVDKKIAELLLFPKYAAARCSLDPRVSAGGPGAAAAKPRS